MKRVVSFILIVIFFFNGVKKLLAQKDTVINGIHYKSVEKKQPENIHGNKRLIPLDSEWVENNKRFRYYNNWFTFGAGIQQNLSYDRKAGFTWGADFDFHIKRQYFQTGVEISGARFQSYQNYQCHLGYGLRYEDKDVQVAGFIGPSYSTGVALVNDTSWSRRYYQPGVYTQFDVIKKVARDVGVGASIYADWNQEQTLAGLRLVLYFSGSYKGKKYYNKDENGF